MKKMLCAIWELDALSVRRLEALAMAASGHSVLCDYFHPHITLGTYEDMEETLLKPYMSGYAKGLSSFKVRFSQVGLLSPSCAVCFPDFSGGLNAHYHAFHQHFDNYSDQWTRLAGGLYHPHVSLYGKDTQLPAAVLERLQAAFTPFGGLVTGLALSWVKDDDEYEILAEFPLEVV
jgi:2'-5' RNA ligase